MMGALRNLLIAMMMGIGMSGRNQIDMPTNSRKGRESWRRRKNKASGGTGQSRIVKTSRIASRRYARLMGKEPY